MEIPVLNQSPVTFKSEDHTYWLGEKELKGVTSTLIRRAFPNTYAKPDRYTDDEWKEVLANAAAKGSNVHETIELHDELGIVSDLPELQSYIRIKDENNLSVVATEYVVSDEKHYATAVDKVMMRPDGGIILVDFKRTSELHIDNVTLQQSICKRWFEKLNPDLKVAAIYVADEAIDLLIDADQKDEAFDIAKAYGNLPMQFASVENEVARLEKQLKELQDRQKTLKEGLYTLMEEAGVKSWTGSKVKLTRVLPTTKTSFDSKSFKEAHPDLFKEFSKESTSAGSLRITVID